MKLETKLTETTEALKSCLNWMEFTIPTLKGKCPHCKGDVHAGGMNWGGPINKARTALASILEPAGVPEKLTRTRAKRACHQTAIPGQYEVTLIQTGVDRFTVQYGKQVKQGLSYGQAAAEYGACIMHALACAGKLDNREKGEQ